MIINKHSALLELHHKELLTILAQDGHESLALELNCLLALIEDNDGLNIAICLNRIGELLKEHPIKWSLR
jgi:hypothetical protein